MSDCDKKRDFDVDSLEKTAETSVQQIDELIKAGLSGDDAQFLHDVTPERKVKVYHKVRVDSFIL
jgi:hypothetical protein